MRKPVTAQCWNGSEENNYKTIAQISLIPVSVHYLDFFMIVLNHLRSRKPILTAVWIRYADYATPFIRKSWY
jgi:hypothetical protein